MAKKYYIGFDIGGTKVSAGLIDKHDRIIIQKKYPTPPKASAKDILKSIDQIITELITEQNISIKDIAGIGFGVPGIVDLHGTIIRTPNLNLDGFSLKQTIEEKYNVTAEVGNDVNVGLLGEKWFGAGQGYNDIIGIFPGTGVGGGIIHNKKFMTGVNGAAAELGHMTMNPNGPKCTCGNNGCLEAYAGRWAIERDINKALKKGTKSIISDLLKKSDDQIKSSILAKAWNKDDKLISTLMENVATMLGHSCISLRHIFDPDVFIFGGGVVEACGDKLIPIIKKILDKDPFFSHFDKCPVLESSLADDAIIFGAVALVSKGFSSKEESTQRYYPYIYLLEDKIIVNGRPKKGDFIVHANGRIKKYRMKSKKDLDLSDLSKKSTDILIIGADDTTTVHKDDRRALEEKNISVEILPINKALDRYRSINQNKSLIIFQ